MLKAQFHNRNFRNLLILFSVIALTIIITGILIYKDFENHVKLDSHDRLSILAKVKIKEVNNWRKERINDAGFIFKNEQVKGYILEFLKNGEKTSDKFKIAEFLRPLKENHEYSDIVVLDPSGRKYPLYSSGDNTPVEKNREYFIKCIEERKVVLSDIYLDKSRNAAAIMMSSFTPLFFSDTGKVFAVVEIKMDPAKNLFTSIQFNSDNLRTVETFIIRKEGSDVLFLNKLKHADNELLDFRLPLNTKDLPAAMAIQGKTGIFEGHDYSGKPVLADLRRIPDSPWFIISKIDKDEIYLPLKEKFLIISGFVFLLVILCGFIMFYIWKHQQYKLLEQNAKSEIDRKILQERIDYLVLNANDIILLIDNDDKIVKANEKAIKVYGYTFEEFSSLKISDIRAEHTLGEIEETKKKIRARNGMIFETVHVNRDGHEFPVEVSSSIIEIGGKQYFQSIIRDITERKTYEARLEKNIRELDRLNKDLEQVAYVSAHDLQEPLRMVHTYAQLIEKMYKDKLDGKAPEYFIHLTEGARRMQQLVNALLKYTSINLAERKLKPVDLNEVIETVKNNLEQQIKESCAVIKSQTLPVIMSDYTQMVLLFQNLIDNSIKYRSSRSPEIDICVERKAGEWMFIVHDNGIGIKKDYFDKIFLIFQRLHERTQYPGIGFGLTINKKIVEHHGGRIWVESQEGDGTRFCFTIPRNSVQNS